MQDRLATYTSEFTARKTDINNVLTMQTAVEIVDLGAKMDDVKAILETMGRDGRREVDARRLVEMREGAGKVLQVRSMMFSSLKSAIVYEPR